MTSPPEIFDRQLLVRRRARGAGRIDQHDFLLQRVADDIVDRLATVKRQFANVLVLGAHHGVLGRALAGRPGLQRLVEMDACAPLLARCSGEKVLGDEEALPFAPGSFDLVVSALSLQFVNDLPGTLLQVRHALKSDGLMLAALCGGATLTELRQSLLAAEAEMEDGASPRVAPFADVRDLGALLQRAGFALPVADADVVTVAYAHPLALMQELRAMGGGNVLVGRRRTPLRRATLARACEIYLQRFARPDGRVTATFEIVTLTGWAPHESQQQPLTPGSARTRLADALGAREGKLERD